MITKTRTKDSDYCDYDNDDDDDDDNAERHNLRFSTISSLRHELSPTHVPRCNCVQITWNTSGAYVVCHVMRWGS